MREIKQNTYMSEPFYMTDSADFSGGVTGLVFPNSGDAQLSKAGGAFVDITSEVYVTDRGFGWYVMQSSVTTNLDTLGRNALHITATVSDTAVPADVLLDVVQYREPDTYGLVSSVDNNTTSYGQYKADVSVVGSVHTIVSSMATQVDSTYNQVSSFAQYQGDVTGVSSIYAEVASHDQYKADISALLAGVAQGTITVPTASVESNTPIEIHQKANFEGIFYLPETFAGFVTSEYPVWFTCKQKPRDADADAMWTVQGSVTNADSMSAVFSLSPTNTDHDLTDFAHYDVQFRTADGGTVKIALTGGVKIIPTYKKGA